MAAQGTLFPESNIPKRAQVPQGFRYQKEFLTAAQETALVASLGALELKPFEFHGYTGNRRVKSFGYRYDYSRSIVEPAESFPPFLDELRIQVAEFAGVPVEEFRQGAVNEYRPGAGIGWHRDKPQFGVVVGVSLLAPATMRLRRAEGTGWIRKSLLLMPRSAYVLDSEARTAWEHSIPPLDQLRYSLTFRTLSSQFKDATNEDRTPIARNNPAKTGPNL